MDYEKKHKEVLEGVKKIHSGIKEVLAELGDSNLPLANILNEAVWALNKQFPELTESEDERIRKEIISALKFANDGGVYDKHIAYLEKQKECVAERLKSLRPQPRKEIYQAAKHDLAIKFMNYLDENRPKGKMSLSNGECENIDKAFKENDWATILKYAENYSPSWKPSEEQMSMLLAVILNPNNAGSESCHLGVKSLYEDLKKLI